MDSLNHALFLALNVSSTPSAPVVLLALIAAKYLILLVPLHIMLVWAGGTRAMRCLAICSVVAITLALVLNGIIGLVAYTPRPFIVGIGHTLVDHRPSASFPSNHGTVVFTYAILLALFSVWRLALVITCIGLLVAWSRVYLGVHFPLDMLGAALIGALISCGSAHAMLRYGGRVFHVSDRLHFSLFENGLLGAVLSSVRTAALEGVRCIGKRV